MVLSTICTLSMSLKNIPGSFLSMLMDGKKRKRFHFVKLHHFSPRGTILSEMPVNVQRDVLQRDADVYRME